MRLLSLTLVMGAATLLAGCRCLTCDDDESPCEDACGHCATAGLFDVTQARTAKKLEVQVDVEGNFVEVEYHCDPATIPQTVRDAMDAMHPGGPFTDAERELDDGVLYYELSRIVNGLEVEAMFSADGQLHSEEIEVRAGAVPAAVRDGVKTRYPEGKVAKWEEIHDGQGQTVEFHVKADVGGKRHKLMFGTDGELHGDVIEMVAEIEVPAG